LKKIHTLNSETAVFDTAYDKREGYLLTTRGNTFGNLVKDGDKEIMHSATGNGFEVPILKRLAVTDSWKRPDAMVAMSKVVKHNEPLECYACHASWVPQYYGCHVEVNYGKDKEGKPYMDTDWITGDYEKFTKGQPAESPLGTQSKKSPAKVFEKRYYLRWEEPVPGLNGEGRMTPLSPRRCAPPWNVPACAWVVSVRCPMQNIGTRSQRRVNSMSSSTSS
jgi:hypothetical protein